jgi:3-phenylpropionate/cinnamic acid dioxygenase small subunit
MNAEVSARSEACSPAPAGKLIEECEAFLVHEARLLDEGKFDAWLELFTQDAQYWVPSEPNQESPFDTVSLMYDDRRLLETRVRRLAGPRIYSQEPRSRTSRTVSNVTIEDRSGASVKLRSKFIMVESRRNEQRLFAGTIFHHLVRTEQFKISFKRVDLLNCDAPMEGLVVPF